jgi:hypothetical protein
MIKAIPTKQNSVKAIDTAISKIVIFTYLSIKGFIS